MRSLANYNFSNDYVKLYELAKTRSIVCEVDYVYDNYRCRDIAQTISQPDTNYTSVTVRGMTYISCDNLEDFVLMCEKTNLRWIIPNN